ncbi:heterokaryon incompatibility protein-domain-containing protein, partial [Cladorrhinum samala]
MEARGTTPPAYIRRQRREKNMPRFGPRREFQEFEYAPLVRDSEIRLFVIPPAEEGWVDLFDGIAGNLIRADLLTEPEYDALSYSWGSESGDYSRDYQILISPGTPDEGVVRVTHNCAQAITRLRLERKPRAVWIDAICINQKDPSERSHQVSIMSNIYTSARRVVAYTGRGSAQTDQLFDYLNSVDEKTINAPTPPMPSPTNWLTALESEIKQPGTWLRRKLESSFVFRHRPDVYPQQIIPDDIPQLALAFFNLRYFTRVWTLQETLLPSLDQTVLICGDKTTSAARALHVLIYTLIRHRAGSAAAGACLKSGSGATTAPAPSPAPRSHLLDILLATRHRGASDPRDRIYGVLSIAWGMDSPYRRRYHHHHHHHHHPDADFYSVDYSLRSEEVYARYSEMFIRHYGVGLWLGLLAWQSRYLPSWAAEWGEKIPFSRDADAGEEKFPAAMRNVEGDNPETQRVRFDDFREPGGRTRRVMVLEGRRRVKQGWVVRDVYGVRAQRDEDDEEDVKENEPVEEISGERGDQVFVEMYPGFVAILKREEKSANYVFVQAAAHGRTKHEAKELAEMWGRVVFDGAGWEGAYSDEYLGEVETFRI